MQETQALPATTAPGPGAVINDRYRLGRVLGRGGMADVLEATDTVLGRDVAIKLFRPEMAAATEQTRSTGEMRVLAALRHPGLVTLHDAGTLNPDTLDERPYFVMELVRGPTLAQQLAQGPLPAPVVADVGGQLADTLAYVHTNGVVHRDVKPANILLDETPAGRPGVWNAKLADFGVARMVDSTRLTQAGMTVGTANYLSPEQATGSDVGPASDVYALGLVLLECLTGKLAFPGSGVAAAAARLHRDPEVPAHLEARWRDLLAAMTRREPDERPPAEEVAARLREIVMTSPPAEVPDVAEPPGTPSAAQTTVLPGSSVAGAAPIAPAAPSGPSGAPRRSLGHPPSWLVLLVAAAACIVAVVAIVLTSSGGSSPAPSRGATPLPTPSYPAVSGTVGSLLGQLETLVNK